MSQKNLILYNVNGKLFSEENGIRVNKNIKYDNITGSSARKFAYFNDEIGEELFMKPILSNKKSTFGKNFFDQYQTSNQKKKREDMKKKREDMKKKRIEDKKIIEQKLKDAENNKNTISNLNISLNDLINQNKQYEEKIQQIKKENETNISQIIEIKKQAEIEKTQSKKEIEDLKQEFNIYKINQEKSLIEKTNELEKIKNSAITEYKTQKKQMLNDYNNQVITLTKSDALKLKNIFNQKMRELINNYESIIKKQNNEIMKIKRDVTNNMRIKNKDIDMKIGMIKDKISTKNNISTNKEYDFNFDPTQQKGLVYYNVYGDKFAPVIYTIPKDIVPYKSYNILSNDNTSIIGINVKTKEIKPIEIDIKEEKKILDKQPEKVKENIIIKVETNDLPKKISYEKDSKKGNYTDAKYSLPANFIPDSFTLIPNNPKNKADKLWQIKGTINGISNTFVFSIKNEKAAAKKQGISLRSL